MSATVHSLEEFLAKRDEERRAAAPAPRHADNGSEGLVGIIIWPDASFRLMINEDRLKSPADFVHAFNGIARANERLAILFNARFPK